MVTQTAPRHGAVRYLLAGAFYSMAHTEWGNPDNPAVVCVHGLTRTGRDFDVLAEALSDRFHVICPDLPGRGASDWLLDGALYQPLNYAAALAHLLAWIGKPVAWVGTSLGGICGMAVAAAPGQPITRMVLNDVGPFIPKAALARIRGYIGNAYAFQDLAEIEAHLRRVHAPFGPLTDPQWAHLVRSSARQAPDGGWGLHYDPKIAEPIVGAEPEDVDLWAYWDRISIPVLAIRGEESDLCQAETIQRMAAGGTETLTLPGIGHAPALMDAQQVTAVRGFLLAAGSA